MEEWGRVVARAAYAPDTVSAWYGGDTNDIECSEDDETERVDQSLEFKDGFVYTSGHPRILLSWGERDMLGSGTYAKVYRATSLYGCKTYALKLIVRKVGSVVQGNGSPRDPKTIHSVLNECNSMWELRKHPNVVRFHEAYTFRIQGQGECQAIVLEYCESDLFRLMKECHHKDQAWPEEQVFDVISRLFGALFYMHRLGWLHRDVKLENVLVKADGGVRLADFGFACRYTPGDTHSWVCGSPHYSCPEIASGDPKRRFHGPHADIWSAFVVLFAMSYLRMPFCQTKDPASILNSIVHNHRTSPPQDREEVPRSLALGKFLKFGLYPSEGRLRWPDQIVEDDWITNMLSKLPRERLHSNPLFKERRFMDDIRKTSLGESVRSVMTDVVDSDQVSFARFLDACALEEKLRFRKTGASRESSVSSLSSTSSSSSSFSISLPQSSSLSSPSPTLEASLFPSPDVDSRLVRRLPNPVCGVIVTTPAVETCPNETTRLKPKPTSKSFPVRSEAQKKSDESRGFFDGETTKTKEKKKSKTSGSRTCVCWSRNDS